MGLARRYRAATAPEIRECSLHRAPSFDDRVARLRAVLDETRETLDAVELAQARAARHVAAADYAMLLVSRIANDMLGRAPLAVPATSFRGHSSRLKTFTVAA